MVSYIFFGNWIADTSELRYTNQHHESTLFIEGNYEHNILIDFLDIKYLRLPFPDMYFCEDWY